MLNLNYICNLNLYSMQERFKQLLEEKELTATRFAAMIKVNASAMSHILNGRSKPGFDVLDKIAQAFPDVNLNWLISGKGTIYNNSTVNPIKAQPVQKSLFEEEPKKPEAPAEPPVKTAPAGYSAEIGAAVIAAPANKKIKRIILFFDDGSFEDYAK